MISCNIIHVVILTLVGTVTAIPENFLCCRPEVGTFQKLGSSNFSCWDKVSNTSSPVLLTCPLYDSILPDYFDFVFTQSGKVLLSVPQSTEPAELKPGELCFANETDAESGNVTKVVVICLDEEEDGSVLGYCMLVSAIFLLITTVVYASLPEVRDLQGKSIINFCGSMGLGLAILSRSKLLSYTDMTLCAIRGFMIYFFIIAAFFWTNAISIQILLSLRRPVVNNYSWKKFLWYALYAWGCPTVLTVCMAIVNYYPGDHVKPGIGLNNCWFFHTKLQWYYMYSVMTILIIANICIFIYTSVHLWRLSFSSSHVKALRYKFILSLRMFIVMGITWIFEMISTLTEKNIIWFILDVFNALQGPLIFLLLVVFRKRVVKALLKRGCLECMSGPIEKYLAVQDDDEEGVIQHTIDVTMDERNGTQKN